MALRRPASAVLAPLLVLCALALPVCFLAPSARAGIYIPSTHLAVNVNGYGATAYILERDQPTLVDFDALAGQVITVHLGGSLVGEPCDALASIVELGVPQEQLVAGPSCAEELDGWSTAVMESGRYRIVLTGQRGASGRLGVSVTSSTLPRSISVDAEVRRDVNVLPGEEEKFGFWGVGGSTITGNEQIPWTASVRIETSDGHVLATTSPTSPWIPETVLPATDVYWLVLDGGGIGGSAGLNVSTVRGQVGTIEVGRAALVELTVPHITATFELAAVTGQHLHVFTTGCCGTGLLLVFSPDGEQRATGDAGAGILALPIDVSGTWKIVVDPPDDYTFHGQLFVVEATTAGPEIRADGPAVDVNIAQEGQAVALPFDGRMGEVVSALGVPALDRPGITDMQLVRPDGSRLDKPSTYSLVLPATTLDADGRWTLLVGVTAQTGSAASVRLFDVVDVERSIAIDGEVHRASTRVPGQRIRWSFAAAAGSWIFIDAVSEVGSVKLVGPNGTSVDAAGRHAIDATGTWSVEVSPYEAVVGHASVRILDLTTPTGTIVLGGSAVDVVAGEGSQTFNFAIAANAGQRLVAELDNRDIPAELRLVDPAGDDASSGWPMLDTTLRMSGTYHLNVLTYGPGRAQLRAHFGEEPSAPIERDGPPAQARIDHAGDAYLLSFAGATGDKVAATWGAGSFDAPSPLAVDLVRPDGTTMAQGTYGHLAAQQLDADGTWSLRVDPWGTATGTVDVQLLDAADQVVEQVGDGPLAPVRLVPGGALSVRFDGVADSTAVGTLTASTVPLEQVGRQLLDPDGNAVDLGGSSGVSHRLEREGRWTFVFRSYASVAAEVTPSVTVIAPLRGRIELDGPATPLSLLGHQEASLSFEGSAGVTIGAFVSGLPPSTGASLELFLPDGRWYDTVGVDDAGGGIDALTLPMTGTYELRLTGRDDASMDPTIALVIERESVTAVAPSPDDHVVDIARPGQRTRLEVAAPPRQRLRVLLRSSTFPSGLGATVVNPVGQTYAFLSVGVESIVEVDASGPLSVRLDPWMAGTGTATVMVAALPEAVLDPVGAPTEGRFDGSTQVFTFDAAVGDELAVLIDGTITSGLWRLEAPDGSTPDYAEAVTGQSVMRSTVQASTAGTWRVVTQDLFGAASLKLIRVHDPTVEATVDGATTKVTVGLGERARIEFAPVDGKDVAAELVGFGTVFDGGGPAVWFESASGRRVEVVESGDWSSPEVVRPTRLLDGERWTLVVDPRGVDVGTVGVRLVGSEHLHGDLVVDGPRAGVSIPAGSTARYSFEAQQGQMITAFVVSKDVDAATRLSLLHPLGYLRTLDVGGGGASVSVRAYSTGTWQLIVDNGTSAVTGEVGIITTPPVVMGHVELGGPSGIVSLGPFGQAASIDFEQRGHFDHHVVEVNATSLHKGCVAVTLWAPDHRYPWNDLGTVCDGDTARRLGRFIREGTWSVRIAPIGVTTGTVSVSVA